MFTVLRCPGIKIPGYNMGHAYFTRVETLRYKMGRAYGTSNYIPTPIAS